MKVVLRSNFVSLSTQKSEEISEKYLNSTLEIFRKKNTPKFYMRINNQTQG